MVIIRFFAFVLGLLLLVSCDELGISDKEEDEESKDEVNVETEKSVSDDVKLNAKSPLAINIAPFNAWTPGWVLIDLFPKSRTWVSNLCDSDEWESGPEIKTDSKGWVSSLADNQCVDTSVMMNQAQHYPDGTYVLLWEGEGAITVQWDIEPPVFGEGVEADSRGIKRLTFQSVKESQSDLGIGIRISKLGENYIKNIRLIPPGGMCGKSASDLNYFKYCASERGGQGTCAAEEKCFDFEEIYWDRFLDSTDVMNSPKPVFHPLYAQTYQMYRAVRYMKWTRVEDSHIANWDERVTVDEYVYTDSERGLPLEHMIAFSNLLNADMYLTVPMKSTDDYHRSMADFVKQRLGEDLKVYLEYGNEIFNSVSPLPYGHAIEQAETVLGFSSESDFVKSGSYAGFRSGQIFDIWREKLGDDSKRFVGVLVGFNPISEFTNAVLDYKDSYKKADALAINGYIGPSRPFAEDKSKFDALTAETLLQEINDGSVLQSGASLLDLDKVYKDHAALAASKDLVLLAYEGGNFMELDDAPQSVIDMFFSLNSEPNNRLADAFVRNIQNFLSAGGREFFYFLNEDFWTAEGAFGARRFQDLSREEAPVFDKLMHFIENNPCTWDGC